MKFGFVTLVSLTFACAAYAEKSSVKVGEITGDQDTTISIKKGAVNDHQCMFEIISGDADIEGDPAYSRGDARKTWKAACDAWKTELKDINKGNEIVGLSCNSPSVGRDDAEKSQYIAHSKATYKVKIRGEMAPAKKP